MRLTVGTLLASMSAILVSVVAAQGIFTVSSLSTVKGDIAVIADYRVPAFILLGQLNADLGHVRLAQEAVLNGPQQDLAANKDRLIKATGSIEATIAKYEPLMVDEADGLALKNFKQKWAEASNQWKRVDALQSTGSLADVKSIFYGDAAKAYDSASAALQGAVDDMAMDVSNEGAAARDRTTSTISFTMGSLALAVLLALASGVFGNRFVSRPLRNMTKAMKTLAAGDTSIIVPYRNHRNEIGDMAQAMEVFREAAHANKRLEAEARDVQLKAEADRLEAQRQAEEAAAERLKAATSGLGAGLRRLASGDLSFQLEEPFAPEFEPLRNDFNQSVSQLAEALVAVAQCVTTMETGTTEIASSADDLSKRTEKQAASLEETAAAVNEITTQVATSNQRTEQALQTAAQANVSAAESAKVVTHAEDAMHGIENSAKQIGNIIGVIDEIAFQTNLLALNAGVEAARAGEAGKGFAVVAQEVRELAQRAAKAAREIRQLIDNSTAQVTNGVTLVRDTGAALKMIGGFIEEINEHMRSIATSAKEQTSGLVEVNQAVNEMDKTTQQNASMVEQTNAAAAGLAGEAARLRDLIGRFKLNGSSSSQAAALRQTAHALRAPSPAAPNAEPRRKAASGGQQDGSWQEF